jgi:uncharacterized OsmC-like protein
MDETMTTTARHPRVGGLIRSLRQYLTANPERASQPDSAAVATTIDADLRCVIDGGDLTVRTDMPSGLGGRGVFPSPGWYVRAGVAACAATAIAMRAAELDVALDRLQVTAQSRSDARGLMGMGAIDAGPESVSVHVEISAPGTSEDVVRDIVAYADANAPNSDAIRRAIPMSLTLEILSG